jgi:hypothetical protein
MHRKIVAMVRLCARVVATPICVLSFGVCWVMFVFFIGAVFQVLFFLENEVFDWAEHIADCNEFFCEPLVRIWGDNG